MNILLDVMVQDTGFTVSYYATESKKEVFVFIAKSSKQLLQLCSKLCFQDYLYVKICMLNHNSEIKDSGELLCTMQLFVQLAMQLWRVHFQTCCKRYVTGCNCLRVIGNFSQVIVSFLLLLWMVMSVKQRKTSITTKES